MNLSKTKTFEAYAIIDLKARNFTLLRALTDSDIFNAILKVQEEVFKKFKVKLPVRIADESLIIFEIEKIKTIYFLNHPKFPIEENILKEAIIYFTLRITEELLITQTTLVLPSKTLLFETDVEEIDEKFNLV